MFNFSRISELFELFEDYEEPKVGCIIDPIEEDYVSADLGYSEPAIERAKELGIWLETEEEAEKAVEKLKAWQRLKEKGFRFTGWNIPADGKGIIIFANYPSETRAELDLLFGGEE